MVSSNAILLNLAKSVKIKEKPSKVRPNRVKLDYEALAKRGIAKRGIKKRMITLDELIERGCNICRHRFSHCPIIHIGFEHETYWRRLLA
jgi:hypothetical protein